MKCICLDGTCEFCVANLFAAEQRVEMFRLFKEHREDFETEIPDVDTILEKVEVMLEHEGYIKDDQLPDMDEYVERTDLKGELEDFLENESIVQSVAAGAAESAMRKVEEYCRSISKLNDHISQLEKNIETVADYQRNTTFGQRLHWMFTGTMKG
jgi:predicted transcriptional regulator